MSLLHAWINAFAVAQAGNTASGRYRVIKSAKNAWTKGRHPSSVDRQRPSLPRLWITMLSDGQWNLLGDYSPTVKITQLNRLTVFLLA